MSEFAEGTFRALFERSTAAMLLADDERRYQDANPAACAALGLSRAQILRLRIDDLTPPEVVPQLDGMWQAFLDDGTQSGEFTLRLPSGKDLEIFFSATANIVPGLHLTVFPSPGADEPSIDGPIEVPDPAEGEAEGPGPARLTPREREVVTLLALGLSGADIAERLVLSPETVRVHIRNARRRLGARTRAHVIALALQAQEIEAPSEGWGGGSRRKRRR